MAQFIDLIDQALPPYLCLELIDQFEASRRKAPGRIGGGLDRTKKHSIDLAVSEFPEWSGLVSQVGALLTPHLVRYARRFTSLVLGALSPEVVDPNGGKTATLTVDNFEQLGASLLPALLRRCYRSDVVNLQKYEQGKGSYQHWHSEIYPERRSNKALRRVLFWICYLNDVSEGGETDFLYQSMRVQPRAGRLLIAPTGFTHTHRGNIPTSGNKYILTSWLIFPQAEELYADH